MQNNGSTMANNGNSYKYLIIIKILKKLFIIMQKLSILRPQIFYQTLFTFLDFPVRNAML